MKVYYCEIWDDLCDWGETYADNVCYLRREDAMKRAHRLELYDYFTAVREMELVGELVLTTLPESGKWRLTDGKEG